MYGKHGVRVGFLRCSGQPFLLLLPLLLLPLLLQSEAICRSLALVLALCQCGIFVAFIAAPPHSTPLLISVADIVLVPPAANSRQPCTDVPGTVKQGEWAVWMKKPIGIVTGYPSSCTPYMSLNELHTPCHCIRPPPLPCTGSTGCTATAG
uniref:Putative secreted peptide n=1 Tax=Anopheles braziliensis TaxID=58242 RepID=A0A2M3ZT89_9DIPT